MVVVSVGVAKTVVVDAVVVKETAFDKADSA